MKLLAIYQSPEEEFFFSQLKDILQQTLDLTLTSQVDCPQQILANYKGLVSFLEREKHGGLPHARLTLSEQEEGFFLPHLDITHLEPSRCLQLGAYLTNVTSLPTQTLLDKLPLHFAISDQNQAIIYHNHKPKDPFLIDDTIAEAPSSWLLQEIMTAPQHTVHQLIPSLSLEQILIHSYQGIIEGDDYLGTIDMVQDIKPLLASYLQETGQAIVGWSDTTSGASIKGDLFEEDF